MLKIKIKMGKFVLSRGEGGTRLAWGYVQPTLGSIFFVSIFEIIIEYEMKLKYCIFNIISKCSQPNFLVVNGAQNGQL